MWSVWLRARLLTKGNGTSTVTWLHEKRFSDWEPGVHLITLRGMTWDHSRGFTPLVATAQVLHDSQPDVELVWDRRSLWAFGEGALKELAHSYDLLVVDYPMMGMAADAGLLLALDEHVPPSWLEEQARQSAGPSHGSYQYHGHQWAAAIDAACQVSVSRPDLMSAAGLVLPETLDDVIRLARDERRVVVPLWPVDILSTFCTLCANQGEPPYRAGDGSFVKKDIGSHALNQIRSLFNLVPPTCIEMNPPQVLSLMAGGDVFLYCPFSLGYSNYSRKGFAKNLLAFHNLPSAGTNGPSGSLLGGAGLAVSAHTTKRSEALKYLMWVASAECQSTVYVQSGGQPGNRVGWESELANLLTANFFANTLDTLDGALVRPRHPGFPEFQTSAGGVLREFLLASRTAAETLAGINRLYANSLGGDRT